MTTKKRNPQVIDTSSPEKNQNTKSTTPLVFISHDTRDAELAEEFSNLLKSASAGGLKSFRSSDKKGTQGIEYGLDWYPAIMEKIDEASDVVCLLTQRSVERPWILYEAGVAKGKLGKKVIGIAIGIQHSIAFTGPFAQFQNNEGSVESITKLVIDLVCNVPGLDPERSYVEQLVRVFHSKASEIVSKYAEATIPVVQETNDNIIVAKLFEEVKIMFESLPARIENRIEPEYRRKKRKFSPMLFEELVHLGSSMNKEESYFSFLIMLSFYKDELPWFYEIGMETYRNLKSAKNSIEKEKIIMNFRNIFDMLDHPMMRDFYGESKDTYFLLKEVRHMFIHHLERMYNEKK